MTTNEKALQERIKELEAKLAAKNKISYKVSEKGAVSVYGLQRMPVTLYAEQWDRLLNVGGEIKSFIATNKGKLTFKNV